MKKIIYILFVLVTFLSFWGLKESVFAMSSGKMLVSPVSVPTVQSSYGAYPNVTDMVANDIINSINKYSSFGVPDINSSKELIESYGLSKHYKEFLMNYLDNRVVDYKTCSAIGSRLGIDKILLVSSGIDIQNMFLNRSGSEKYSEIFSTILPFGKIFSKDLVFIGMPFIGNRIYNSVNNETPITPFYKMNINLALIDTNTGLVVWEKEYNKDLPANNFGNPTSSFGENTISTKELKKFSEKIARETSFEVYMAAKNSDYLSVKSIVVPSSDKTKNKSEKVTPINNKYSPRDGKMTKDGHPSFSNEKYLENKRKQSYKNWVKERTKY